MKKILFVLAITLTCLQLRAQQEHHYTHFMYTKMLINPAYAGARGVPTVMGIYRNQWAGFDGAPQSFMASFNSPFLSDRVGVGINLSHLKIGLQRDFQASLAYSYDVVAREGVSLRLGILGSVRSLGMDFAAADPLNIGDPSLNNAKISEVYGNVGAGIYGTFSERIYVGLSVPRIYSNVIGLNQNPGVVTAKVSPHFYAMAGAIIPLSEDINLMPALLLKYVENAPFDADINFSLDIREKVTAGISYRPGGDGPGESVDLLVFWQATPQLGVGAAYDFALSQIRDYSAGSFEVMAQVDLKKKKKTRKRSNPRFFM
jgi:type IX secretion system PorP/SprF family membrane protein